MTTTELQPRDRYLVVSSDGHAGADLLQYKEYLPARWHDEFDAWAAAYENPFADLLQATAYRNWDSERRLAEAEADGVVAEVLFPNTVPPFFARATSSRSRRAEADYDRRWAGLQAHNRWLVDFCRAGPRPTRGDHPDLPQRRRRRGRRDPRALGPDAGVRRRAAAVGLAQLRPPRAVGPVLRAAVAGVRGARHARSTSTPGAGCPTTATSTRRGRSCSWRSRGSRTGRCGTSCSAACSTVHPDLRIVLTEQGVAWVPARPRHARLVLQAHDHRRRGRGGVLRRGRREHVDAAERVLRASTCWVGASFLRPERGAARARHRRRPHHVGPRLPAQRGHVPVHHRGAAGRVRRACRPTRCSAWSAPPRPSSTASTSTRSGRSPTASVPRWKPSPSRCRRATTRSDSTCNAFEREPALKAW